MGTHDGPRYSQGPTVLPLLSVNDVARYLAISRRSVYNLAGSGAIRSVRVGERLRFRPAHLERYLNRGESAA